MKKMYKQLLTGGVFFFAALGLVAQPEYISGTLSGSGANTIPFYYTGAGCRGQMLYPAGCFGTVPSGQSISKIYFSSTTSGTQTYANFQVYIGQPSITSLTTTYETGLTQVLNETSYTYTRVASQWNGIELTTNFPYDPTLPLVIEINQLTSGGSSWSSLVQSPTITGAWRNYAPSYNAASASGAGAYSLYFGFDLAAPSAANDAGVEEIVSPTLPACAGQYNLVAAIKNFGINQITPVTVNWSLGGVTQTPVTYTGTIDTVGGNGSDTAHIMLGTLNLTGATALKVWTSQPNNTADTVPANDTLEVPLAPALEGVYTIQSSGGDFSSFTAAVSALSNYGICDDVTFLVGDGSYNEQIALGNISGTSDSATITFKSNPANSNLAVLTYGPTGTANNYTLRFNGAKHITFDSLEIRTTGTSYSIVVDFVGNSKFITVSRNNIAGAMSTSTSTNNAVIYNPSGQTADSCYILDNEITGGSYGMYWYGNSAAPRERGHKIIGNEVTGYYYMGIYSYYHDYQEISNNLIQSSGTYTTGYGMYIYYNDNGRTVGNNVILENSGTCYGIYHNYGNATINNPAILANNFVSITTGTGTKYGMNVSYNSYLQVIHNSINISSATTPYGLYFYNTSTTYMGNEAKNNNIAIAGSGYALYRYNNTYDFADGNNFYAPGSSSLVYAGTAFANLAAYQAAGNEPNSINVDPEYMSATDLHTCNALLHDVGVPTGLSTDIDGQTRGALPDIGADEFMVGGPFDLGPDTTLCTDTLVLTVEDAYESILWAATGMASSTEGSYTLGVGDVPQTFTVNVVADAGLCGTAVASRTVRLVPDAKTTPADGLHLCAGDEGTITANGGAQATYQWHATGQTTKTISVDEFGIHKLVKNEEGCVSEAWITVTQSTVPAIEEYYGVCPDAFPLVLDATITHGTGYTWTGGNSPASALNTFDEGGEFTLTVEDSLGCTSVVPVEIEAIDVPKPAIIETHGGFSYTFSAGGTGAGDDALYMWVFSDDIETIYYGKTVSHTFPFNGGAIEYTVTLTVENTCGQGRKSESYMVNPLGVANASDAGGVLLYPNPAQGRFTVVLPSNVDGANIEVVDITGRAVKSLNGQKGNAIEVNVTDLQAGSYLVRTTTNNTVNTQTVIIQ